MRITIEIDNPAAGNVRVVDSAPHPAASHVSAASPTSSPRTPCWATSARTSSS